MMSSLFKVATLTAVSAFLTVGCATNSPAPQAQVINVHAVNAAGVDAAIGTISFQDSDAGLVIQTDLKGLPAGERGFHIHENASCEPAEKEGKMGAALAAGSHLNTNQAANHGTPTTGHLGDLPALTVAEDGSAQVTVVAPRLKLADIQGRAIMVHAGGDNYSDTPKALGGGGDRIACGVIQ